MNVVIIEDEELAAKRLEGMIKSYDSQIKVVAKLESVEESVEWFNKNNPPDLIFLDIHLEDDLSFVIFEKVSLSVPIIFTTAYDEYALKAFKLKSIDYLLKPIDQAALEVAIEKYKSWNNGKSLIDVHALYDLISNKKSFKERFSVTVGTKIRTIPVEEVAYFYSSDGITMMVSSDKKEYPLDYSLENLTPELNPKEFFRINRQFLVKLSSIANVHIFPKSRLKIDLNPPVKEDTFVSVHKVSQFKEWLDGN